MSTVLVNDFLTLLVFLCQAGFGFEVHLVGKEVHVGLAQVGVLVKRREGEVVQVQVVDEDLKGVVNELGVLRGVGLNITGFLGVCVVLVQGGGQRAVVGWQELRVVEDVVDQGIVGVDDSLLPGLVLFASHLQQELLPPGSDLPLAASAFIFRQAEDLGSGQGHLVLLYYAPVRLQRHDKSIIHVPGAAEGCHLEEDHGAKLDGELGPPWDEVDEHQEIEGVGEQGLEDSGRLGHVLVGLHVRKDRHDEDVVVDVLGLASEAIETSNEYPYPQRRYKGIAAQNRFGLCGCFSCAGEQTCFHWCVFNSGLRLEDFPCPSHIIGVWSVVITSLRKL